MSNSADDASRRFDGGLYCAESVLVTIAERLDIQSELIPGIATGFCSGMSRTCGPCGALTGGILGLNLALGRNGPEQSVEANYAAVQELIEQFQQAFGTTNCAELLGCDLGTEEGLRVFNFEHLERHCREFTGKTTAMAIEIIQSKQKP